METDAVIFCKSSTGKRLSRTETWNTADEALLPSPPFLASECVALQLSPLTNTFRPRSPDFFLACVHVSGVYHRQQLWSASQLKLGIIWFDSELVQQIRFNRIVSFLDSASWETLEALPADCSTGVSYLTGFKLFFHHKLVWKGPFFFYLAALIARDCPSSWSL